MSATDFTCPMFSATSTRMTGTNRPIRGRWNSGVWNGGSPKRPCCCQAVSIRLKSTSSRSTAVTYPMATPSRIDRRPGRPRKSTETRMMEDSVTSAVTGASMKLSFADGARLNPMSATMVPVTSGGMSFWSQAVPANCTTRPMRNSAAPAMRTPPSAPPGPYWFIEAVMGAMKAKDEPR